MPDSCARSSTRCVRCSTRRSRSTAPCWSAGRASTRASASSSTAPTWRARSTSASRDLRRANPPALRVGLDIHPQPREGLADEPRDLHLRDTDALGDLGLRHVALEAQAQDLAVALAEDVEGVVEQDADLRAAELGIGAAERLGQRRVLAGRLVERARAVRLRALQRVEHVLEAGADLLAQLLDGRRAAELVGQIVARLGDLQLQLLRAARYVQRPGAVAEVALDLAEHGRRGVRREAHLP